MNENNYIDVIKSVFTEPIQEYTMKGGYGNIVFEMNNEWIFRFSKEERDLQQLEIEKSFLPEFAQLSALPVPHIEYQGNNFIGYRKLDGIPLDEVYDEISEEQKNEAWKSIGEFLTQLHATDFTHKNLVEYPMGDADFWNDLWKPIETQLSEETRKNALKYFTEYFQGESKNSINKTLCHGDFHPNHILFNQSSKKIAGIIDFGRVCVNDPAVDFNLIERFFGKDAINTVLQYYTQDIPENFRERITFQNRRRLFAAFFHAKIVGQTASFPRYLQRIEDIFSN
ncbi:MAG: aminoglycoside phosphotransferase family protein [Candidatus Kerfeldbacteria bacterium]|nr:aminoglycoside phosphotransferase family protein [Candidatus Kerfeldbacteria bacterium]